jgi:hypothetical protein
LKPVFDFTAHDHAGAVPRQRLELFHERRKIQALRVVFRGRSWIYLSAPLLDGGDPDLGDQIAGRVLLGHFFGAQHFVLVRQQVFKQRHPARFHSLMQSGKQVIAGAALFRQSADQHSGEGVLDHVFRQEFLDQPQQRVVVLVLDQQLAQRAFAA